MATSRKTSKLKSLLPNAVYTDTDRERSHEMFLQGANLPEIARATGISMTTLKTWSTRGDAGPAPGKISWAVEREEIDRSFIEDSFVKRRNTTARAANIAIEQQERGLKALSEREMPPTPSELERLASVHNSLDRIARLDSGKSTENLNVAAKIKLEVEDIRAILKADPLAEDVGA